MTDRELMINAFEHRYSGRFPSDLWAAKEPRRRLMDHFGVGDIDGVHAALGITKMESVTVSWSNPEWEQCPDLRFLGGVSPKSGRRYLLHDERTFEDEWGIVLRMGRSGLHDEWVRGPLSEVEDPDPSIVTTRVGALGTIADSGHEWDTIRPRGFVDSVAGILAGRDDGWRASCWIRRCSSTPCAVGRRLSVWRRCAVPASNRGRRRGPAVAPPGVHRSERGRDLRERAAVCGAARLPARQDSGGVAVRVQGADAVLESLDAWQMRSVYRMSAVGRSGSIPHGTS